jgi:primosomal protein N' (replication factor Y)
MYIILPDMHYFEVLVADSSYKSSEPLTYSYFQSLTPGTIVDVPLKQRQALGVVLRAVPKPTFKTKPLSAYDTYHPLPAALPELALWLSQFYPAGLGVTMQQFLPSKLYELDKLPNVAEAATSKPAQSAPELPPLTPEQSAALDIMHQPDTYLLHGETGSGKTRVYIELAQQTLRQGRSAIVLTPEIGLTPQLAKNFIAVFGEDQVVTTHSKLTAKERNLAWLHILQSTKPLIVIGPRSALFSPLANVGVIILDESHEGSYKQEQAPHYHASKVAAKLVSLHKAILVLGSATPAITDAYLAQARNKPIIRMHNKAAASTQKQDNHTAPEVQIKIVDLKDRAQFTRQPHLSNALLESITVSLQQQQQSLVFLNRRGTARIILCEQCGWQSLCPHCDLPLTYHGDTHSVRCHTCGFTHTAPNSCPECGSANIILKSIGTKAIVDELQRAFPQARIQRFDTDNSKEERLEVHYDAVRAGEVDIIVGTQLIAKGLDLPNLTTVGVVVADTSLYLPDYSSGERSYQLLRQVIGRVGRGHQTEGRVVIQTYEPDSPSIKTAVSGAWDEFYQTEIQERQAFMFPPFCHTLKIWCRRATSKNAQTAAEKVVDDLRHSGLRIIIDGPTPAFYEKIAGKYQWQAVIKSKDRGELVRTIKLLPSNWSYDIDPSNLL